MRLIVRVLAAAGVTALAVAVPWSYAARTTPSPAVPVLLFAAGTAATVAAVVLFVLLERRPGGLVLPAEHSRLPVPAWWWPVSAVGLVDLAFGAFVSIPAVAAGAVLLVAAAVGLTRQVRRGPAVLDRETVRAARRIRAYAAEHAAGGEPGVDGTVEYVGRRGARIVLVGRD